MKLKTLPRNCYQGLTLIETTVVLVVLIGLVTVLFISADAYQRGVRRAGCAVVQDKIRKLVVTELNFNARAFESGVDYYTDPAYQFLYIEEDTDCPENGDYTAVLDSDGRELEINCTVHGNLLRELSE